MNLDWELLRRQKAFLIELAECGEYPPEQEEMFDGIINLIDSIQDYAIINGNATEEEVFGVLK